MKIKKRFASLLILSVAASSPTIAAEFHPAPLAKSTQETDYLVPIKRVPPIYPQMAVSRGQSGWILIEFDVEQDGSTSNVVVSDAEPPNVFNDTSIRAVKKWKYRPWEGSPKTRHIETVITFELEGMRLSESREFKDTRQSIERAIEQNDWETAKSELSKLSDLEASSKLKVYYQALFEYAISLGIEDYLTAHHALIRTLSAGQKMITKDTHRKHLRQLFLLEVQLSYFGSAIYHFKELDEMQGENGEAELRPYYEKILTLLQGSNAVLYKMQTETDCVYCNHVSSVATIRPFRTDFQIQNIIGKVDSLTIQCDKFYESYQIADPIHIRVKDGHKDCKITISGDPGAAFDVIEFWDNPAEHTDGQQEAPQE